MQADLPRRPARHAALSLLPALMLSIPTSTAAMAAATFEAIPSRIDFQHVARVSCPKDAPVPRSLVDAAACGDLARLRARIDEGKDAAATDARPGMAGRTALHHAVQRGDGEAVGILLSAGANANAADRLGNTSLHLLALRGRSSADDAIARALLGAGGDARVRNARNRTALEELVVREWQSVDPVRIAPNLLAHLLDEAEATGPVTVAAAAPSTVRAAGIQAESAETAGTQSAAWSGDASGVDVSQVEGDAASAVRTTLEAWAAAWSAGDVPEYLAHYASDFRPAGGKSVEVWRAQRRERVGKAEAIRVQLAEVEVSVEGTRAAARFVQDYRSKNYKAVDRKLVTLVRDGQTWKIVEESAAD